MQVSEGYGIENKMFINYWHKFIGYIIVIREDNKRVL